MPTLPESIFFLDRSRKDGLQAQIRETIVSGILAKRLAPGTTLPSTRRLATYLGVSRITITLAFQELATQGYLEASERRGFVVSSSFATGPERQLSPDASDNPVDWASRLRPQGGFVRPVAKPLDWRRYPFPFVYGQIDPRLFDLSAWRDCSRRALARDDFQQMAGDLASSDDPQLVDYICSHTLPSRGIAARPDEVLVTLGAQNAIWMLIQILLGPGRVGISENPCHPDLRGALEANGCLVATVDVDDRGLPPEALPEQLDVLFVTPSHQAPTAATMPMARRRALLRLAAERDFLVVEDDYEFEMSFLAPPLPALKSLDRDGRVLYVGSFSKSLFPGLRLGYLVAPAPLVREVRALRALILRHPPGQLQRTTAHFLALGHYHALIGRMREEFEGRHATMADALRGTNLRIAGVSPFGGTSFWLEGPPNLDTDRLALRLRDLGVLIEPGTSFFPRSDQPCRYFRMAYSSIARDRIAQGVALTSASVEELAAEQNVGGVPQ